MECGCYRLIKLTIRKKDRDADGKGSGLGENFATFGFANFAFLIR